MPGTGGFIGKARLEGGAGHGAVIFPAAGHHGTLHEHPADAHQKLNISSNRAQRDKPFPRKGALSTAEWRFPGSAVTRAQKALKLARDLRVNWPGTALALDLLDEIERLRLERRRTIYQTERVRDIDR